MTPAWTLGYPPAYRRIINIPGNAKAPGGYAFRTRRAAAEYAASHAEASRYRPFRIYMPCSFAAGTTRVFDAAARARHEWHTTGDGASAYMAECGVCSPREVELDCDLLVVEAPFILPAPAPRDLPA